MSDGLAIDEIVLKVPATAACGRIVRVGAAAVALRQGMSFTEIDELRAALDQATELLLAPPAGPDAAIVCVLRARGGHLEVDLERTDGASVAATDAARFKRAADASNVTATVESERGRLSMRKDIGRPRQPARGLKTPRAPEAERIGERIRYIRREAVARAARERSEQERE